MKSHFVLIDLENIQPQNLALLQGDTFGIKVFVGPGQPKIPIGMAQALQTFGADAEYLKIEGGGKNALDFHIAYYIGRLSAENPGAVFHIVSKDGGFDPLVKHLHAHNIRCSRHASVADIVSAPTPAAMPAKAACRQDH
jgi:hypothetical protein